MANQLPWLGPFPLNDPCQEPEFYSPSDQKSYRLPIPDSLHKSRCLASCHDWLLLLVDSDCGRVLTFKQPLLFNPITATQILLPLLLLIHWCPAIAAMSTTPTDPDCVVLLVHGCRAFLYRPNDHCATDWTIIRLTSFWGYGGSAICYGGRFYCSHNRANELYVIDPFLQEAAFQLAMRNPYGASTDSIRVTLYEIGGELFSVQTLYRSGGIKRFRVFKADLSGQEWVRVEMLSEHLLFHHDACSVFLLAADVGCKRNSIYACKEIQRDVKLGHNVLAWDHLTWVVGFGLKKAH